MKNITHTWPYIPSKYRIVELEPGDIVHMGPEGSGPRSFKAGDRVVLDNDGFVVGSQVKVPPITTTASSDR